MFLTNFLEWNFGADAFADSIVYEQSMGTMRVPDESGMIDPQQAPEHCNHGCHAANYFLGLVSVPLKIAVLRTAAVHSPEQSVPFPSREPDERLHPPIPSSQA